MTDKLIYIYSLSDPETNEVRYVGKTVQKPSYRYSSHLSASKYNRKKDYAHCWIKSVMNRNLLPVLNIIEETYDISRESYWIKYYRDIGNKLTNFTDGGDLGNLGKTWKLSKEAMRNFKPRNIKPVLQYDTNGNFIKRWEVGKDFARYYNMGLSSVSSSISQKVTCCGYILILEGDILNINNYKPSSKKVNILDTKTNIEYICKSAMEAARKLNLNNSSISYAAREQTLLHKRYKIKYI